MIVCVRACTKCEDCEGWRGLVVEGMVKVAFQMRDGCEHACQVIVNIGSSFISLLTASSPNFLGILRSLTILLLL